MILGNFPALELVAEMSQHEEPEDKMIIIRVLVMFQCVSSIYPVTTLRAPTRESNGIPLMVNLGEMNFLQFLVSSNFYLKY